MFRLISKERLLRELQLNAISKGKGVLNWFVKDIDGNKVIFITYDVYGVTYLFSDFTTNFGPRDMLVCGIDMRSQILGISNDDFAEITAIQNDTPVLEDIPMEAEFHVNMGEYK